MSAPFTDEQVMIQDMALKFSQDRLAPHSEAWDEDKHFPVDVIKAAAELGFAGIYVRDDVGGSALSRLDAVLIFEQLSRGDVSTAAFISIHNMACWIIDRFGNEDKRQYW
ncbi:MAG: acyl-CoA dehydrogenase family protein, partial [Pseudomonadota bacterium]